MKATNIKAHTIGNATNNNIKTLTNKDGYIPFGVSLNMAVRLTPSEFGRFNGTKAEQADPTDIGNAVTALLDEVIKPEYREFFYWASVNKSAVAFPDDKDKETNKHNAARAAVAEGKKERAAAVAVHAALMDGINAAALAADRAAFERLVAEHPEWLK